MWLSYFDGLRQTERLVREEARVLGRVVRVGVTGDIICLVVDLIPRRRLTSG